MSTAVVPAGGRRPLRLAVASGKGGTGKTTVATNLAAHLARAGLPVTLVDADVEEPDAALFLRPAWDREEPVEVPVPRVDESACTLCGRCSEVCEYHAIVALPTTVLVYDELCHSCGACALFCPTGAISERPRRTGTVRRGRATIGPGHALQVVEGRLDVGEARAVPVVRPAPPPFGLNDLRLAVAMVRDPGLVPPPARVNGTTVAEDAPMVRQTGAPRGQVGPGTWVCPPPRRTTPVGTPVATSKAGRPAGWGHLPAFRDRLAARGRHPARPCPAPAWGGEAGDKPEERRPASCHPGRGASCRPHSTRLKM